MSIPSFSSSPWIRGAPQRGFACAIVRISVRTSAGTLGRPMRRRLFQAHPPQPEAPSVPGDDGLRLDDHERRSPSSPDAREQAPEPTVRLREPHPPPAACAAAPAVDAVTPGLRAGARRANAPWSQAQDEDRSTDIIA